MCSLSTDGTILTQKVVLITGCGSGIGLAIAVAAGKAGYIVYAGLRDLSTQQNLVEQTEGLSVHPVQLDVTNPMERTDVIDAIVAKHDQIDILINNAGIGIAGFLEELTEEELRRVFEINFFAIWALTTECLPFLRKSKGHLVMISSLSGQMAIPGIGSYCASKFALEGLTETWRHELKPFGIKVLLIQPGAYRTNMTGPNRKITTNTGTAHEQYTDFEQAMTIWYDRVAVARAIEPSHLAEHLLKIFKQSNPKFRHPIGPSTGWRRIILNCLPFGIIEWYFGRLLNKQ